MRIWRELTIASTSRDAIALVDALREFSSVEGLWRFQEEQSTRAEKDFGRPACVVAWQGSEEPDKPVMRLAAKCDCPVLELKDIIPWRRRIDMDEHNLIVGKFAKALRCWVRHSGSDVTVKLGRADLGLEQLVSSGVARNFFRRYLERCRRWEELATHTLDVELLDRFTCALHTYSRKPVNLCELERYLVEDCHWSENDARWCIKAR